MKFGPILAFILVLKKNWLVRFELGTFYTHLLVGEDLILIGQFSIHNSYSFKSKLVCKRKKLLTI